MTGNRFEGKVALVTGAGSGIGRAVALRLASEGAAVFGHDRDEAALAATAAAAEEGGGSVVTRVGDLLSPEECAAAVAACVASLGRLDVLGNVAGIARSEHVTDVGVDAYRRMMGINTDACFFLSQAAIPHLLETGGNIVNMASNAGLMGQAYTVVYCMSKGALIQLTRALAMEFMKTPLRVNAIAPGGTDTELVRAYRLPADLDVELVARYSGHRGLGDAAGVAALFAFVASDDARHIHGAVLSCDAGVTAG